MFWNKTTLHHSSLISLHCQVLKISLDCFVALVIRLQTLYYMTRDAPLKFLLLSCVVFQISRNESPQWLWIQTCWPCSYSLTPPWVPCRLSPHPGTVPFPWTQGQHDATSSRLRASPPAPLMKLPATPLCPPSSRHSVYRIDEDTGPSIISRFGL